MGGVWSRHASDDGEGEGGTGDAIVLSLAFHGHEYPCAFVDPPTNLMPKAKKPLDSHGSKSRQGKVWGSEADAAYKAK